MKARFAASGIVTLALLGAASRPAGAQQANQGFQLEHFAPSERGSDWFASESLDLRGNMRPAAGLVFDWAHNPLVLASPDHDTKTALVADQVVLHAGASIVLIDRLRVAFDMPLAIYETGTSFTQSGTAFTSPDSFAAGDLRLGADVRLFGTYGDVLTVAAGLQLSLPTGSRSAYMSDGTVRLQPRVLAAGNVGPFAYAARLGFEIRPDDPNFATSQGGSALTFSAAAGIRILDNALTLGPEIFGTTIVTSSQGAFQSQNTPFELLLGGHYATHDFRFGLAAGPGLTRGFGSPAARMVASVEWAPGYAKPDGDHDGVPDAEDACIGVAGVASSNPETNGCPADRDRDSVIDADDACPEVAGVRTSDPKTNGCPADRDGDGVLDAVDACPEIKGVSSSDPKLNGCAADGDNDGISDNEDMCPAIAGVRSDDPKVNGCPADRDHDAIVDAEDMCPDVAGVRSSDAKYNGCPVDLDHDKDGIPNDSDACPEASGKPNKDPKKNGCPLAYVEGDRIRITEQVKFKTGSTGLDPSGDGVLVAVVKLLADHPEIRRIRIEGHTDNVGNAARNQKLSEGRVASVVTWLVAHGVDRTRLSSEGFGATRPLVPNDDEVGRRQNRRVEFHIEMDDAGTTAHPQK